MNILMGIGNIYGLDDGVGCRLARRLSVSGWKALDCATAPENFTGIVRQDRPELLLMVDAADMGLPAGSLRRVSRDQIQDVGVGTHMLPLYHLIDYLRPSCGTIVFIGVQPLMRGAGEELSEPVRAAEERLLEIVERGSWESIPMLEGAA